MTSLQTPALRASGLTRRFASTLAIDGVDLAVAPGEVRGLLGPNGAGKTTLLRMLLGLVRPDAGEIELLGRRLTSDGGAVLDGVAGFVEEPTFYPYLSGEANLRVLAELDGDRRGHGVADALEQVGLARRGPDRVSTYSTGMRQRLGLAAALMRRPRLLMLDEPTSGLDPAGVADVLALVRELSRGHGVAVLLCSHHIDEVEAACDSFTVLRSGATVWEGTAAQLRAEAPVPAYAMSTSDDRLACELAREDPAVEVEPAPGGGLVVTPREGALDAYIVALGKADVAIRGLTLATSSLESMFFALTTRDPRAIGEPAATR